MVTTSGDWTRGVENSAKTVATELNIATAAASMAEADPWQRQERQAIVGAPYFMNKI